MDDRSLGSDLPPGKPTSESATERLLRSDHYTPRELAELLDIPVSEIETDAFAGRLQAEIIDHNIISISRSAAITWLNDR